MGFHICITNERVAEISTRTGIYGNVGNNNETRGIIWGKIKDLYAVKPGDFIILYIKSPVSVFKGIYEVTTVPYICYDNHFDDGNEMYPFRFNFKINLYFPKPVPSFEFYGLVESGKINSLMTLTRDVNSSYRGIRQLFETEFDEILQLFYKYNPKTNPSNFTQINQILLDPEIIEAVNFDDEDISQYHDPVQLKFNRIPNVRGKAILEDVLHAYIVYNVLHNNNDVRKTIGLENFDELILEAPIFKSMQFRSDIMATFKHRNKIFYYSFFELKKDTRIGIEEISQLIGYLKSFAASKSLTVNSYEGVYISNRFDPDLIDYLTKRKVVENENIISLISYSVNNDGFVNLIKEI